MNDKNLKNVCLKFFYFCKILKMRKKYCEIRKLFCFCFILYVEKMFTEKVTINRRWAKRLKSLVIVHLGSSIIEKLFGNYVFYFLHWESVFVKYRVTLKE